MKKIKIGFYAILLLIGLALTKTSTAQNPSGPITPGAKLDTVFDRFGNKYNLRDIRVDTTSRPSPLAKTVQLCSAGYFDLYFETGSGMEGAGSPESDRRAVICQVFSDISVFIGSPLNNPGNTNRVKIWVRDISTITSSSGVLGLATAFYSIPGNANTSVGGIIDNEIWKTIHTGVDSYSGICSPLVLTGGTSGGTFYHGMMAFNFSQPGSIDWNTTLTTPTITAGYYDLYTVALHEITHALGFASLINFNGLSKFGTGFNYYSRYDLFLKKGSANVITNTGACNGMYDYQFNSALSTSVVAPGCTITPTPSTSLSSDLTTCSVSITYSSSNTNVPVYTPVCFEPPSSLSHFEDICQVPGGFTTTCTSSPTNNNLYYVMSNANGTGDCYVKRYLKPEERAVLCDIGYSVTTTYGSSGNYSYKNYGGSTCPGITVSGLNDGIVGGSYSFVAAPAATVAITNILGNDVGASTFECLQDITDPTSYLSVNTGIISTSITFSSTVVGTHLLRYVPVSAGGQRGNITYVYVYVLSNNCTPTACDLVNNGGAENSNCGYMLDATQVSCWDAFSGSPDVYSRSCSNPSFDIMNDMETFNGAPNNTYVGLYGTHTYMEAVQINLSSPLIPSQSYLLSFWASESNFGSNTAITHPIQFSSLPNITPPISLTQPLVNINPNAVNLAPSINIPDDNSWHYFSVPFVFSGSINHNNLIVYNNGLQLASGASYFQLDGISIKPLSQTVSFDLPSAVCNTVTLTDLSTYLTPPAPGGIFSGPGVGVSGGIYSFTASVAGLGSHNVVYTYTNNLGCQVIVADNITVSTGSVIAITPIASPSLVCVAGSSVTLTATGATTFTWQPGNLSGSSVTVSPTSTTQYTVTGTVCSNTAQAVVTVTVNTTPTVTAVSNPTIICANQTATLTASGATTYSWSTGSITNPTSVTPTVTTIYTVTGTTSGCSKTNTVSVSIAVSPTVAVSNATVCSGLPVSLSATGANTYSWSTGATTSSITVSPTVTTIYTVTGTSTVTGCSNTRTVAVTVIANPNVTVNSPSICFGGTAVLNAGGATTYSWNTGATTSYLYVAPTSTTIYTVTGTATSGCITVKTGTVTVISNPTVTVSNATICAGTSTVLTASGATTYAWNTGATTNTISVAPMTSTAYIVTGTINGCSNTKTVTITVNSLPTITAVTNPTLVCPSQTVTLTAGGAISYTWSTGATTTVTTVTPTITTTYTVIGTNASGCTNTKTVTVNVNPPLVVTSSATICATQSITLTATGATTYSWNTGATTSSISVTPSVTTVYTVTGTSSGCMATRTVQVYVKGQYCCQSASFSIGSATTTANYSNNSNGSGAVVDVLGSITFTANSTMTNYVLRMAPTASITINLGVTVTFSNCTIYSCTDLWGGIFINDGVGVPGIVNVTNSRIEDMYAGITHAGVSGGSTGNTNYINVTNSVLNNNYVSIHLRNYPHTYNTAGRHGLSVTGTTITSQPSSTSPQTTLKTSTVYAYPYNNINNTSITYTNFPRGAVGIYLYNLTESPVIIGDSTGTGGTNRFENLDFGVYAENASPKAFNNHFINITGSTKQVTTFGFPPPPPPAGPAEIGVAFNAILTVTNQVYYVRLGKVSASIPTGGNPFPGGNKFENCGKGISITKYQEPFIKGNLFTAAETDVPPLLTPSSLYSYYKAQNAVYLKEIVSNATVKNNYILNQATGVYASYNINNVMWSGYPNFVKIEDNLIEAPATNGYCRQAINVEQPLSTTNLATGMLTVKNNTVQNVYRGILALNVKAGLQINSNPTIKIDVAKMHGITGTSSSQINNYARTGILAQNCVDIVIANNPNIIGNGTIASAYYTAVKGIWVNASTGTVGQVNCNTISNVGRCMQFTGTSLNKISKNVMNGAYQGFVLSGSGVIGNQGVSGTITNDNEWSGFTGGAAQYAETYVESTSNANTASIFYLKPGSPYFPTQNYSNGSPVYSNLPGNGLQVQSPSISGESCLSLRMMGEDTGGGMFMRTGSYDDSTNTDLYEALVSDTTFYDVYQNETQYRNKQLVYELLNKQSIDTTSTLNEFYNAHQNSNYQTLITINEAIATSDYQTAQSINSSLTSNNAIEEYQKRVNELLVKYLNYQPQYDSIHDVIRMAINPVFDGTELADLMTIASSCLDKYGNVITQARVLVNNASNRIVEFEDNCNPEYNSRKATTIKADNSSKINVRLYPNPNKGIMTIDYDLVNDKEANMNLYDIAGKLITTYKLQSTKGTLQMNEQTLQNGIYFYHILVGEKTVKTDKIVIIK